MKMNCFCVKNNCRKFGMGKLIKLIWGKCKKIKKYLKKLYKKDKKVRFSEEIIVYKFWVKNFEGGDFESWGFIVNLVYSLLNEIINNCVDIGNKEI